MRLVSQHALVRMSRVDMPPEPCVMTEMSVFDRERGGEGVGGASVSPVRLVTGASHSLAQTMVSRSAAGHVVLATPDLPACHLQRSGTRHGECVWMYECVRACVYNWMCMYIYVCFPPFVLQLLSFILSPSRLPPHNSPLKQPFYLLYYISTHKFLVSILNVAVSS